MAELSVMDRINMILSDPEKATMTLAQIVSEEIREFKASPEYAIMLEAESYPNKGGHFLPKCRKGHGKHKIDDEWPSYCDGRTVSVKEDFYFERRPDIESF